jgi:hypothetical protein
LEPIARFHKCRRDTKLRTDLRLIEWWLDPSQLEDDETPLPSRDTIQLAIQVADLLRCKDSPAPTRIVPDAHGGIVFEFEAGSEFASIRISKDGSIEFCVFQDCQMVHRQSFAW